MTLVHSMSRAAQRGRFVCAGRLGASDESDERNSCGNERDGVVCEVNWLDVDDASYESGADRREDRWRGLDVQFLEPRSIQVMERHLLATGVRTLHHY